MWRIVLLLGGSFLRLRAQDVDLDALDPVKAYQLASSWIVENDPKHQAWAAELIARYHFETLRTELLQAFHDLPPSESDKFSGSPQDFASEAVADALIKLNVKVSSNDARRLYPTYPALAMILLSQTSDDNKADLLSILEETKTGQVWLAAADLLAEEDPPPEFVAWLVDDFSIFVRILVSEPGTGIGTSYGDCYSPPRPPSTIKVPVNWPAFSTYSLQLAVNGGTIFARGINAVSYFTSSNADPLPWTGRAGCGGLTLQDLRRDVIVQLSGIDPKTVKLRSVVLRSIFDENDYQCRLAIVNILKEQFALFNNVVGALRSRNLLTQSPSELPLHMEVWVVPLGTLTQLPELPPLANLGIAGEYHHP